MGLYLKVQLGQSGHRLFCTGFNGGVTGGNGKADQCDSR